ncbi:MAG: hypothetical protein CL927_12220 [Deltaproteobacteria bacterium]|nr:hypothetical protein [Deltaproteobacteria bacterium]HCH65406.1 hypothetical protein [Deltaproteobacteria bacterium]
MTSALQTHSSDSDVQGMEHSTPHSHVISTLAQRFATEAPALIDALVFDYQFARGAAPRHVQEALAYILAWPSVQVAPPSHADPDRPAQVCGGTAILLHDDAPFTSFARTVPAAVLSGCDRIVVNVAAEATATRALLERVCSQLPNVEIQAERSSTFLFRALTDADIRTVWAGGDAHLLAPFEALVESSGCQVFLESPGNDPIIVADGADIDAVARETARLAFRDGGLDPASPNRVYVLEALHDAFSTRVCAYAAAYEMAQYNDIACSVSPMRSREAREHIYELLDEAEQSGAVPAVGLIFRQFSGQTEPTLYPTVVVDCRATLRIVRERTRGPVLPLVPYSDTDALLKMLDDTAGPDGLVGAAVTLFGDAALQEPLSKRFSYLCGKGGPHASDTREARLAWGGGPASCRLLSGREGLERRYGPVDLMTFFSHAAPALVSDEQSLEASAHAAK